MQTGAKLFYFCLVRHYLRFACTVAVLDASSGGVQAVDQPALHPTIRRRLGRQRIFAPSASGRMHSYGLRTSAIRGQAVVVRTVPRAPS